MRRDHDRLNIRKQTSIIICKSKHLDNGVANEVKHTSSEMDSAPSGSPSKMSVPALYMTTSGMNSAKASSRFLRYTKGL
jgi:hypothetical protein